METLRAVYRHRLVEAVLLSCVTLQVPTGSWLVLRRWKQVAGMLQPVDMPAKYKATHAR